MRPWTTRPTTLHPAWTYSLKDFAGAAWGVLAFSAAMLAPGYVLQRVFTSRRTCMWSARERLAWSVALSFGPGVLLLAAVVALGGASAGGVLLLAFAVAAVWLARGSWRCRFPTDRSARRGLLALLLWVIVVLGSLVDLGTHGRLWMSVTAYDHGLRTAFVEAVLRTGAPPVDPVYWPGHDVPMRYYYFWYEVCAAVARMAHITARQALIASCVWPALGVVAMVALFGRYVLGRRGRELTRLVAISTALLSVCGLDLLVIIALHLIGTPVMPDMEWWSIDQVASWPDTFLWVPHHAAALVAAMLGILLLLQASCFVARRDRILLGVVAGLSFAAAFGMSAYVAVGAVFLSLAGLLSSVWRGCAKAYLQALVVSAMAAGGILFRFLHQLTQHEGAGAKTSPLYFGVREILDPTMLTGSRLLQGLSSIHPLRAREIAALILLVPGWAVELGLYGVVLVVVLSRFRRTPAGERTLIALALSGLVASSFLRSGIIATNDYGIRSALLAQFCLLLLAALVLESSGGKLRKFLWVLAFVGAGASIYQIVLLRVYLPAQDALGNSEFRDLGERTYVLREMYDALQPRIPPQARLQFDPAETSYFLYPHLLYGNHQLVTAEFSCTTSFGGDQAACPGIQKRLTQLFTPQTTSIPNLQQFAALCTELGAQYLVSTRWDSIWQAQRSWARGLPAVVDQPAARVVTCVP